VFNAYDRNEDSKLNELELTRQMVSVGRRPRAGEAMDRIRAHDTDGDGQLDFREFVAWYVDSGAADNAEWREAQRRFEQRQAAELRQSSEETDDGDDGDDGDFEDANSAAAAPAAASETPLETWQRLGGGDAGELNRADFNRALEAQDKAPLPDGDRKTFFEDDYMAILSGDKTPEDLTNVESTVAVESAPEPEEDEGDGDASGPQPADAGQSEADAEPEVGFKVDDRVKILRGKYMDKTGEITKKTAKRWTVLLDSGITFSTTGDNMEKTSEQSAAAAPRRSSRRRELDESPAVALSGAQPNWEYSTEDEAVEDESLTIRDQSSDMEFAESSAVETDSDVEEPVPMLASVPETSAPSSEMEFAESSTAPSSEMEFAESSAASAPSSEMEFAESSAASAPSSELDFAESSAMDTDSEMEFAASSAVSTSGMDFAESSAVDTDSAREDISEK